MTGIFTEPMPEKCKHYAAFMKDLPRAEADIIFWCLFVFVILLLVLASCLHARQQKRNELADLEAAEKGMEVNEEARKEESENHLRISILCFLLAVPAVTIEVFALFSIQFCDGEDLMMLYWAFWTLLQTGSAIAIFGVMIDQAYVVTGKNAPRLNTAHGTPVVVVATLGQTAWGTIKWGRRKWKQRGESKNETGAAMRILNTSIASGASLRRGFSGATLSSLFTNGNPFGSISPHTADSRVSTHARESREGSRSREVHFENEISPSQTRSGSASPRATS